MDFVLPPDLEVMHQPIRLRILTVLYRQRTMGFGVLRSALDLTAGNLASHLERLESHGHIAQRRTFGKGGHATRIVLTPTGEAGFRRYLGLLRDYLLSQPN